MSVSLQKPVAKTQRQFKLWTSATLGVVALLACSMISISLGLVAISPLEAWQGLIAPDSVSPKNSAIIWSIRIPRILVAALVGAALATVGAVMQAILRNPLAEPGITGVSAGAAVGAVAGITLGFSGSYAWGVPLAAFAGAASVALILQTVLQTRRDLGSSTIILVGVSLSALCGAMINLLIAHAKEDSLVRSALFWLAGDLNFRDWSHVAIATVPILLGLAFMLYKQHTLDALALGEQVASTSGVNVNRERTIMLLVTSLVTGAAVAVSGIISFVGLVVPHVVRLLVGATHSRVLPLSTIFGALFVVLADTVARIILDGSRVQTGVVCAIVGAPIFLFLLLRQSRG